MLKELKEKYGKVGQIAIRPYCDQTIQNMGLETYGYVLFPGTYQMEEMACVTYRGQLRYLNGLDEFAPEVKALKQDSKEAYEAKVKNIRSIVSELELEKTYNKVEIDDKDFWSKVETFRPDNKEVWSDIKVKCNNDPIFLNPITNTDHLLLILSIESGGFPLIGKSLEDCKSGTRPRKWYLDKQSDTVGTNVSVSRIKNKALAMLDELSEDNPRKLFYVAKLVDNNSMQYRNSTLQSVIYDNMDSYITGEGAEPKIKKAAERFLMHANKDMQESKIKAIIKDATFYKFIQSKADGLLHYPKGNIILGKNIEEVYEKLNNPGHVDLLEQIQEEVESTWA